MQSPCQKNRLIRTIDAQQNETQFAYDREGNLLEIVDPLGNVTTHEYDARNRLTKSIDPDGGETTFEYDLNNNLVALIDPVANRTEFEFDSRDRMTVERDPLLNEILYDYDAVDNLTAKTDRNGRTTNFIYDDLDRLEMEEWLAANEETLVNTINYAYDDVGNLLSVIDDFSALTYTYDSRNRVKTVDNSGTPNVPTVALEYVYDGVGNVLSVADTIESAAGATTAYVYDALNRMTQTTQSGPSVDDKLVNFAYNELGQFARIDRYSDLDATQRVIVTDHVYDTLNRLESLTHSNASGTPVAFYDYTYDEASRITSINDVDGLTTYTYDDRSQLTGADRPTNDPRGDESYKYDANGNRTDSHLHGDGYITGDANRLQSDGTFNYQYDNEGNLVRRIEIATGAIRDYVYDLRNRLTEVNDSDSQGNSTQVVVFAYDVLNRRIGKRVQQGNDDSLTTFVYDRDDVILDFVDSDGEGASVDAELDQRYLHGPAVDQVLSQENGRTHWLLADHLGTIQDIATSNGAVAAHISYSSFGVPIVDSNMSVSSRYGFTGREYDQETGDYYYRARYYDPIIGRFTSEDPIRLEASDKNLYRYVENSATVAIDPLGLDRLDIVVVAERGKMNYASVFGAQNNPSRLFGATQVPIMELRDATNYLKTLDPASLDSIHFYGHGDPRGGLISSGDMWFGSHNLNRDPAVQDFVKSAGSRLKRDGTAFFHNCNSGKGENGRRLAEMLSEGLDAAVELPLWRQHGVTPFLTGPVIRSSPPRWRSQPEPR